MKLRPPRSVPRTSKVASWPRRLSCADYSPDSPTTRTRGSAPGPLPGGSRCPGRGARATTCPFRLAGQSDPALAPRRAENAEILLDRFCTDAVAVEVTHRSARRLFDLSGLAPLREAVRPPRRPEPGRGRGRPRLLPEAPGPELAPPAPPIMRFERPAIENSALDAAMAFAEQTIRRTRHTLAVLRSEGSQLSADDWAAAMPDVEGPFSEWPFGFLKRQGGNKPSFSLTVQHIQRPHSVRRTSGPHTDSSGSYRNSRNRCYSSIERQRGLAISRTAVPTELTLS